ncbi:hypothetical protein [Paraburkholderia hospita]|uniref:hypothetical protein n=1 Tax=Paraburkholderia hospita TaxID=169430 RepID=UPI0008A7EBD6|nr:hypothetical protein [Paraburkholderia hospita]SEI14535.1 hypothetical protein SAMN05192544_102555 [Paraburkholderia hospita]
MTSRFQRLLAGTRARQRGVYDLVSLGIGISIAIAFATAGLWAKRQEILADQMAAQGDVVKDIGNLVNAKYLSLYYSNLVNGSGIAGVADPYHPTITELQAINVLPAGYSTTSAYGSPYLVSLAKTPAGCVAPTCDVAGQVYIAGAITDPSTGNPLTLDDAAEAIGGDGGYSDTLTPGTVSGINGLWTDTNPMGNVAGVLAMRVGYGSSGWSAYVRRDGSLPMEGDLNFKGTTGTKHNIANAATVNATTYVSTNGAQSTTVANDGGGNTNAYQAGAFQFLNSTGTAWAPVNSGNVTSNGSVAAAGSVSANGNVSAGNSIVAGGGIWGQSLTTSGGISSVGTIWTNSQVIANGTIISYAGASPGSGCSQNGAIANSGSGPLFCKNNVWSDGGSLAQSNCGWVAIPGGGSGPSGFFSYTCPAGWYIAGYGNYREGDWTRTGEAQVYCCSAS